MFRISQFHALLQGISRGSFDALVRTHQADRYVKKFSAWDQLVAMLYGQLSGATSLRSLEAGFNPQVRHHYHLDVQPVKRSTLADANRRRDPAIFAGLASQLMHQAQRTLRRDWQPMLYLLDSTSLTLTGRGFDAWTAATATRHTQGMKVHVLYEEPTQAPTRVDFTAPNVNDIDHARQLTIEPGATYVFDKGYCDYNWWERIDREKAWFVTRFKYNAGLTLVERRPVPREADTILADEIVRFTHRHPGGKRRNHYERPLRRITVDRPGHDRPLVLATNDLTAPAQQIAERYRQRWQIELFFKWIKQHLRIKRPLGRTAHAVQTQILIALIGYLLLALYKARQGFKDHLGSLLAILRPNLFQRPATEAAVVHRRRQRQDELDRIQPRLFA